MFYVCKHSYERLLHNEVINDACYGETTDKDPYL